mmetsp:Transcript_47103/g.124061  ORF Transcript_47103/g.124061 Transcript_47103/m.124061 type:complete len:213 (+) Transcript_47103:482-1120(+)
MDATQGPVAQGVRARDLGEGLHRVRMPGLAQLHVHGHTRRGWLQRGDPLELRRSQGSRCRRRRSWCIWRPAAVAAREDWARRPRWPLAAALRGHGRARGRGDGRGGGSPRAAGWHGRRAGWRRCFRGARRARRDGDARRCGRDHGLVAPPPCCRRRHRADDCTWRVGRLPWGAAAAPCDGGGWPKLDGRRAAMGTSALWWQCGRAAVAAHSR